MRDFVILYYGILKLWSENKSRGESCVLIFFFQGQQSFVYPFALWSKRFAHIVEIVIYSLISVSHSTHIKPNSATQAYYNYLH